MQKTLLAFQTGIARTNTIYTASLVAAGISYVSGSSLGQSATSVGIAAVAAIVLSIANVHIMMKRAAKTGLVGTEVKNVAETHKAAWVAGAVVPVMLSGAIADLTPKLF